MNVSTPSPSDTPVNGNHSEASLHRNEADEKALCHHEVLDEDGIKALIEAADVEAFRMSLIFMAIEDPLILNNLLLKAFFVTTDSVTFDRTEIIRLLILTGSGCETYRFNSDYLMSFGIEVGNVPLVELIMKKGKKKKGGEFYDHQQLRTAIKNGHEELVKLLLKCGGNVDARDNYSGGITALCTAALHGQEGIARYLLSIGADIKTTTEAGQNALSFAARNSHNALGRLLIDEELKASSRFINSHGIGFQYERGRTSLHLVAAEGNLDLVVALLEAGWDINGGGCKFTPVLDAIYHKHEHVAKFLIEKGSRVDQELLKPAAEYGLNNLVRILLSKGVDANAPSYGQTALEAAVASRHNPEGRFELVKLLLENGANIRTNQGAPLLLRAAASRLEDIAMLLIEYGAPLEGKGDGGMTIVHCAAELGYLDVIRMAVAKGAQLDLQDNDGRTPLHLAACKGHTELMEVLLKAEAGEWVDRKNKRGCTALHEAITANNVEAARVLVEHGASMTCQTYPSSTSTSPLAQAVKERRAEIVQIFIDKGATPDEKIHGRIIFLAVEGADPPTIKALLSGDSKTSPNRHEYITKALDHAIQGNKVDVIRLLLGLGADITDGKAFKLALIYIHGVEVAGILYNHSRSALLPFAAESYLKAAAANEAKTVRFWLKNDIPIDVKNKDGC